MTAATSFLPKDTPKIIKDCPSCGSLRTTELFLFKGNIPISKCEDCRVEFCSRYYSGPDLERFYSSEYFHGEYGYKDYPALESIKSLTFGARLNALEKLTASKGQLLDVGCAYGLLVRLALARGWDSFGIDISKDAITKAPSSLRERLFSGTLNDVRFKTGQFQVITMSDLIEHVHYPQEYLKEAHRLLCSQGLLFIETPNNAGLMKVLMGRAWPLYRPPEHLLYFCPSNLTALLNQFGFEVLQSKTSWKCFTLSYLLDKLSTTNPSITRLLRPISAVFGRLRIWIPCGSFWVIARKTES